MEKCSNGCGRWVTTPDVSGDICLTCHNAPQMPWVWSPHQQDHGKVCPLCGVDIWRRRGGAHWCRPPAPHIEHEALTPEQDLENSRKLTIRPPALAQAPSIFCTRCGGDGGATGNCPRCGGNGLEPS